MSTSTVEASQRRAARVAGFMFLFTMATAISSATIRSSLIVAGDAAKTAGNIVTDERLFRVSIALDLFTFASIVVLPVALYVVLKPVSKNLALLGLSWRLAEATVMFTIPLNGVLALQLLTQADYSAAFEPAQLHAQAMLYLSAYDAAFEIGMILLGLGSIVFNYLLLKSRYIPRVLAAWGIFASLFLVVLTFAILLSPDHAATLRQAVYIPGFIGEVSLGLWLLVKGVKVHPSSVQSG